MKTKLGRVVAGVCVLAMCMVLSAPAGAQMTEVKEKPPLYSYVGFWNIPRAQWAEMEKSEVSDEKTLNDAMAAGTIVGHGYDVNLVHQPDGFTNDDWWSSMSMAGLLNVLEGFYKSGSTTSPVLMSSTKHADAIFVSRYYNWHAGSWKGAYTRAASYKLKADAPDDAVETLSKHLFVPMLEKLLADGAIHEYEIDTEAIHTEDPSTFWVVIIAANGEGLDKFNAAVSKLHEANPLGGTAIGAMVDFAVHRDYLTRTNASFK